jgi:hypothetical protein
MRFTIIILMILVVACIVFLTACKKRGPEADAEGAVARGEYQFIALLDSDGNWTRPQVPEIPAWYFETTGIRIQQTKPETKEADVVYMKSYNDALYQTLKAQGKFHVIEENIARVKANLEKAKQYERSVSFLATRDDASVPLLG